MNRRKLVCKECKYFLAVLDTREAGDEVTVRHKGLFIYFQGGILRVICPKCGIPNFVCDEQYKKDHIDIIESMEKYHNIVECEFQKWIPSNEYVKPNQKENENV